MKYLNIALLIFLFVFSCKSAPKDVRSVNEQLPAWSESGEQVITPEEQIIDQVSEEFYNDTFEDEVLTDEGTDEFPFLADETEELIEADIPPADIASEADFSDLFEQDAEETVLEPETEIAEDNQMPEEEQAQMPFVQELPEETPPVISGLPPEEAPPVQVSVPEQPAPPPPPVQPPTVQPLPAPVQQPPPPVQPPAQTPQPQPPVQIPAQQAPVPPPEDEDESPRVVVRRDNTRETPVTPPQSVVTPRNDEIVFSRIVRAIVGQMIEIPFRGTGWVYLGEMASRRGVVYSSRRLDPEGQCFIFRAEEAGTYVLNFFRQDFIRDYILNDHVQVIVGDAPSAEGAGWFNPPSDRSRVVADPRWPSALEEAEILRGNRPAAPSAERTETITTPPSAFDSAREPEVSQGITIPQGTTVIPDPNGEVPLPAREIIPAEMLLRRASESFNEGNAAAAIALLDQYREFYPVGSDELYWLYGQYYEANSPARNILLSLDYYRRLVREYPQSTRINDARRRIAYLERFYINIQ